MKNYLLSLLFAALLFGAVAPVFATVKVSATIVQPPADDKPKNIATMTLKEFQRLAGRKLTFKEKIGFLLLRQKMRHQQTDTDKQGQTAYILGLAGLGLFVTGLFVPALLIGSFVISILAIVTGSTAKKNGEDNRKAKAGKLLGWITLAALVVLLGLAAIVIASWGL